MAKHNIDNLSPEASASEMEQAIKDALNAQTEEATPPNAQEAIEKEVVETEKTKPQPIKSEVKEEKEAVEEYDYKKGYEGLRSQQTRITQELSETKKALDSIAQALQQQRQPVQEQQTLSPQQLQEWMQSDPLSANKWLASLEAEQKVKPIEAEVYGMKNTLNTILASNSITRARSRFDDFNAYEDDIRQELTKYPKEIVDNPLWYDNLLETSYYTVKGKKLPEIVEKSREEARKESVSKAQAKKDAYVEGAGKSVSEPAINLEKMSSKEIFELMKARGAV